MPLLNNAITVLLIEDDEIDIKTIKYGFKEYNVQNTLVVVSDGAEALNKLHGKLLPDVILLDINMPKMNGFEFLTQLKADAQFSHIPVFIITTSDSAQDREATDAYSCVVGYFVKPLQFEEFMPVYIGIISKL